MVSQSAKHSIYKIKIGSWNYSGVDCYVVIRIIIIRTCLNFFHWVISWWWMMIIIQMETQLSLDKNKGSQICSQIKIATETDFKVYTYSLATQSNWDKPNFSVAYIMAWQFKSVNGFNFNSKTQICSWKFSIDR